MANCKECDLDPGCDNCKGWGVGWGLSAGMIFATIIWVTCYAVKPDDHDVCKKSCEAAGHSEHAFDLQLGCVCSDPYPEIPEPPEPTRAWVQP